MHLGWLSLMQTDMVDLPHKRGWNRPSRAGFWLALLGVVLLEAYLVWSGLASLNVWLKYAILAAPIVAFGCSFVWSYRNAAKIELAEHPSDPLRDR